MLSCRYHNRESTASRCRWRLRPIRWNPASLRLVKESLVGRSNLGERLLADGCSGRAGKTRRLDSRVPEGAARGSPAAPVTSWRHLDEDISWPPLHNHRARTPKRGQRHAVLSGLLACGAVRVPIRMPAPCREEDSNQSKQRKTMKSERETTVWIIHA